MIVLQAHLARLGFSPGPLDGLRGKRTEQALTAAGKRYSWPELSSMPSEQAEQDLAEVIRTERSQIPVLTLSQLREIAPGFLGEWLQPMNAFLVDAHITEKRLPSLLAQLAHESGGFKYAAEIKGSSKRYAPYYGRGPIQLTLVENYRRAGQYLGVDLVKNPDLLLIPSLAWSAAAWWTLNNGLNAIIDGGDFLKLTKRINGGTNGAADRVRWRDKVMSSSLFQGGAPTPSQKKAQDRPAARSTPAPQPIASPSPAPKDKAPEVLSGALQPVSASPPPSLSSPDKDSSMSDKRDERRAQRRRTIRKMVRQNKDFWVGQYLDYLSQGLDPEEALEEVYEDFTDYGLTKLAQRMDRAARWRFINNHQTRRKFEELDGGVFLAVLRGALKVVELAKAPISGLLEESGAKSILREFFDGFSDLVDEVVIEAPKAPTRTRPAVVDTRSADIPTLTKSLADAPSAGTAKSRLLGLKAGT